MTLSKKKSCETSRLRRNGFTLLELLLAFSLAILIFGMIWELLRLYSGHYYLAERKVARSQLIRSLAELLDDDLMSAIQDPIGALDSFQVGQSRFVRRFGLRGNATSLQIDVIEPDSQSTLADAEENRRYATGMSTVKGIQVPELKTIIYEFISPGALEKPVEVFSQVTDGSALTGSLSTPPAQKNGAMSEQSLESFGKLALRYGLSRQELDFETPISSEEKNADTDPTGGSKLIGSLLAPPEISQSQLHSDFPMDTPVTKEETRPVLTAVQLASYTEDHTRWAPEVVELRFRYFDGTHWLDAWNSLEKNGLPLAIEVQLKLMPLDEIDTLRASPLFLDYERRQREVVSDESGSRFIGTLQTSPASDALDTPEPVPQTLEEVATQLGLTTVLNCRVVSWLPTTPLAQHETLKRRLPLPDAGGPYSLGATERSRKVPRQSQDRNAAAAERVVRDRTPIARPSSDFDAIDVARRDFETTAGIRSERDPGQSPATMSAPQQLQTAQTPNAGGWLRGERNTQKQ